MMYTHRGCRGVSMGGVCTLWAPSHRGDARWQSHLIARPRDGATLLSRVPAMGMSLRHVVTWWEGAQDVPAPLLLDLQAPRCVV